MTNSTENNIAENISDIEMEFVQGLVEGVDYGAGLWSSEFVLLAFNEQLREVLSSIPRIEVGIPYVQTLLDLANTGKVADAVGVEEEWAQARFEEFISEIGKEITYKTHDGRWISRIDRRLNNGAILSIRKDVTEEKQTESQLANKNSKLKLAFSAMSDLSSAVVVRDKDLKYRIANEQYARMFGKTIDQIIGKTAIEVFGEEAAAKFDSQNLAVIENGKAYQIEECLSFPDGREIMSLAEVKRIYDAEGEAYACITITDVTELRERERALAEKTSELSLTTAALDKLPAGVMIKDKDTRYQIVNEQFSQILGTPSSDLIGKKTEEFNNEKTTRLYNSREKSVIESGKAIEFEECFSDPEGNEFEAITSVSPITASDGETYACIVVKDVSDLKAREEKLKAYASEIDGHRRRMQSFAETTADWFWETDKDLKFTFLSESIEDHLGLVPADIVGKTRRELWNDSDLSDAQTLHLKTLDERGEFKEFSYAVECGDGNFVWVAISGSPSFDTDGEFTGYMGTGRNISETKFHEQALEKAHREIQHNEKRFRAFAETNSDWFWEMDADLRFSYFSESFETISGVSPDRLLYKSRRETGIPGITEEEFDAHLAVLDAHKPFRDFVHSRTKDDGSEIWLSISGTPQFDADGEFRGYQGSGRDVTERIKQQHDLEKAQQAALKADRAKSEFLANMSHEIRTPMNGVMGMAELLAKTDLSTKQKMFTDVIVKSGASLLTIINDILDFSKLEAGQMELDLAPFSLAEAIEDVATLVSSRIAEKDLELIVRVDPQLPDIVVGDVGRIRQIITNLMGNAVKFTELGHVFVNVRNLSQTNGSDEKLRLRFEIEDTGIGIPKDKCDAVFEKFSQADTSSSRKHEGTGLGLTICSSLVEIMGGEIGVWSEEGKGSTFWFEIDIQAHEQQVKRQRVPMDVTGAKILIIDDNAVNRSILSEQMTAWHFDSAAAVDGYEGLAFMRAAKERNVEIDCVVLDYHMPGMNGGDVVLEMRNDPLLVDIPVVMLTSVDQTEDGKAFSSLRIDAQLTKPARSSHLFETIIEILENHSYQDNKLVDVGAAVRLEGSGKTDADAIPDIPNSRLTDPLIEDGDDLIEILDPISPQSEANHVDIVVCEDNEVNQIVFTQILESIGFSFEIAPNGKIGVELVKKHKPKIILMDVSMPEMNGLEATGVIRENQKGSGHYTPIIGVTAHAIKGDMEKCLEAGMDDYLSKPISPDALEKKILHWMENIRSVQNG